MSHLGPSLRRAKVRERPGRRLAAAALASILLNALVFFLLARAGAFSLPQATSARVALAPVSSSQWSANRAIRPDGAPPKRLAPAPPPIPTPAPPESHPPGQVVDLGPTASATPPKNARFVSEHDSSVEKETRSRHAKAGYQRTLPVPQAPGVQTSPAPGEAGKFAKAVPGAEGPRPVPQAPAGAPKVALPLEAGGDLAAGVAAGEEGRRPPAPGVTGDGGQRREGPLSALHLPPGTLARLAGGPAPDHLEGIEEGEGTFLNAREWKYASYFNRVKEAVAAKWDPNTPLRARDPDATMFGTRDRATLLGVTLDDAGHLKSVVVAQSSGVEFLDRAAQMAFKDAEPFVNPPRGIVDAQGEIKFGFTFVLEFGRPGLRIYRAPAPGMP